MAAAQQGDSSALDALLRRHHDRVYAICRRMAGNEADAADATQEALLALVRGLDRYDGRAKFTTWLYRVATNACLDELRRRGRRPRPTDPADNAMGAGELAGPFDPGDQIADRIDIDRALVQLRAEWRAPLVLRDQLRLDYAEIAAVLEIPPWTVRSRISRGRAALAEVLRGNSDPVGGRPRTEP